MLSMNNFIFRKFWTEKVSVILACLDIFKLFWAFYIFAFAASDTAVYEVFLKSSVYKLHYLFIYYYII